MAGRLRRQESKRWWRRETVALIGLAVAVLGVALSVAFYYYPRSGDSIEGVPSGAEPAPAEPDFTIDLDETGDTRVFYVEPELFGSAPLSSDDADLGPLRCGQPSYASARSDAQICISPSLLTFDPCFEVDRDRVVCPNRRTGGLDYPVFRLISNRADSSLPDGFDRNETDWPWAIMTETGDVCEWDPIDPGLTPTPDGGFEAEAVALPQWAGSESRYICNVDGLDIAVVDDDETVFRIMGYWSARNVDAVGLAADLTRREADTWTVLYAPGRASELERVKVAAVWY